MKSRDSRSRAQSCENKISFSKVHTAVSFSESRCLPSPSLASVLRTNSHGSGTMSVHCTRRRGRNRSTLHCLLQTSSSAAAYNTLGNGAKNEFICSNSAWGADGQTRFLDDSDGHQQGGCSIRTAWIKSCLGCATYSTSSAYRGDIFAYTLNGDVYGTPPDKVWTENLHGTRTMDLDSGVYATANAHSDCSEMRPAVF